MNSCPFCGRNLAVAYKYCPYCAAKLPQNISNQKELPQEHSVTSLIHNSMTDCKTGVVNFHFVPQSIGIQKNMMSSFLSVNNDDVYGQKYGMTQMEMEEQMHKIYIFITQLHEAHPDSDKYKKLKEITKDLHLCIKCGSFENLNIDSVGYHLFFILHFLVENCFYPLLKYKDKFLGDLIEIAYYILFIQQIMPSFDHIVKSLDASDNEKNNIKRIYDFNPLDYIDEFDIDKPTKPNENPAEAKENNEPDYAALPQDIAEEVHNIMTDLGSHAPSFKRHIFNPTLNYKEELQKLTGLSRVKNELQNYIDNYKLQAKRKELHPELNISAPFHCLYKGGPGTGKTTVARLVAGILAQEGILKKGCCVEVSAAELISGWIGFSAKNIKLAFLNAMDGVLFIDEAYSLMNDRYGNDVIDTLTPLMENYRDRVVVILAGYNKELDNMMKSVNTGFASRFSTSIQFEDYNGEEMYNIFLSMVTGHKYTLDDEAKNRAKVVFEYIDKIKNNIPTFANARSVRNVFEKIKSRASQRMIKDKNANIDTITTEDVSLPPQELYNALGIAQ